MTYRALDSFRLFAFLGVFFYHVHLLPVGYVGVLAFFVLSGFLITPILVDMRHQLTSARYFLHFYGRRSLRIFPLYYFYLAGIAACVALAFAVNRVPAAFGQFTRQVIYALTYTYDFFHASREFSQSPLLTHFWSLAVEEQFYLVWPFVIFCFARARLKHVLLAFVLAGPLIRLVEAAFVTSEAGLFHNRLDVALYVLPFSHIDAFAIGGYLALYGRTPSRATVGVYAVVLILLGVATEALTASPDLLALGYGPVMADSWKHVWGYTVVNLLFGWILLMLRDRTLFPKVVEHPTLAYLGKISYGLYVYHFAVIWVLSAVGPYGPPLLWRTAIIIIMLGATILISMASYAFIEAPCLRLKERYFARGAVVPMTRVPARAAAVAENVSGTMI